MTRLGVTRLGGLLDELRPDAVVTVHATPAAALSALAAEGRRLPPHTTVVTDFVAHSQWIARGIDRYCVAAEEVGREFVARGIPRERVVVTGVPLRPEFDAHVDSAAARRALQLRLDAPVVLVMAYYQCPMLCSMVVNGLMQGMRGLAWTTGKEYRAVVVSFDPRDTAELATAKRKNYVEAYGQIDANVSYQVNEQLSVFVEGINLTDETKRVFARHENQLRFASQTGPRYMFGLRYKF